MPTVDVKPLNAWPKVRQISPGVYQVKGHCTRVFVWLLTRRCAAFIVLVACFWLLGAALLPALVGLYESLGHGHPVGWVIGTMIELRLLLRELLTQRFPGVGRAIYYSGQNRIDWHLLGVFIIAYRVRGFISYGLAHVLGLVINPILGRGFKITFTHDTVVIHRRLRSLRIIRAGSLDGGVTFRVTGPEYQTGILGYLLRIGLLKRGGECDYPVVMALVGLRQIKLATPPRLPEAERVVQSFQLALNHTRTL